MTADKKKVLVVEDNPAMGNVVRYNLRAAGLDAELVRDGAEAIERLTENRYDFVVTDYQMPEIDGYELVRRMRQTHEWSSIPVIMLTAKEMEMDRGHSVEELGLLNVCPKPFSPAELTRMILDHLSPAAAT